MGTALYKAVGTLLLVISSSVCAIENQAEKSPWSPEDQDIRILGIRVGPYTLEEIIVAYQYHDVILIPLGALSESIDIAIESIPANNMAQGFIFNTEHTFFLDADKHEVTIRGQSTSYNPELVHVLLDDIYVESNLLSSWLNIELSVNLFLSQVQIISDEPLPFQKRLDREKKIARTLSRIKPKKNNYPKHYEPYRNTSTPFINQTIRGGIKKQSDGETVFTYDYSTFVTADLAKLESSWYLRGNDQNSIDDFRVTLSRTDPESKLLGRLEATRFSFGHVFEPRIDLITQPATLNPGFYVSNYLIGRQVEYDRHTFIGELLPDWEVELYHNNSLLDYQANEIDGQYTFDDVPLLYGSNHFRLVFYGPQGQVKEESHDFELRDSLTKTGEHYYRASLTNSSDGIRLITQYNFGIKKNVSASLSFTSIPLITNNIAVQNEYLHAGIRSYFEQYFLNFDVVLNTNGGNAIELGLQSKFDDIIFGFEQIVLNNFSSEQFISSNVQLTRKTKFNINTSISTEAIPRIPISFDIIKDSFSNGTSTTNITNSVSLNAHNIAYNNQLTFQKRSNQSNQIFGTFQLSQYTASNSIRGTINYTVSPETEFTNTIINYDIHNFHDYRVSFGLAHALTTGITELSATLNKPLKGYNITYGARFNNNGEYTIDANFSIGLGQEPRTKKWLNSRYLLATNGSISARVFIDVNQDGILDEETDLPLSNVGFTINGSAKQSRTDSDGILFLTSLPPHRPIDIAITQTTLDDPLWTPVIKGINVVPRPGKTILLDFPIFLTGEIDGTVYLETNGINNGIGNVTVEIIDSNNRVVQSTETAYDGFYIISDIPIGTFSVRIANKHLNKISVKGLKTQAINISVNERFVNGIDFTLIK